jgi:hypothetical protein
MTADELAAAVGAAAAHELDSALERIKHCLSQLNDAQVWHCSQPGLNSLGNLVLHLCGNLRQWVVAGLEAVVDEAKRVLAGADARRLTEVRRIQGFDVTGVAAIFDSVPYFRGHTQEIVHMTQSSTTAAMAYTPPSRS